MNLLVKEGLVTVKPTVNGYYALDINDKYMNDFFSARTAIEVISTKICAEHFQKIDRAHIKECCETITKSYQNNDIHAFVAADRDFHNSIVSYTENQFLIDMYANMNRTLKHYSTICMYYLRNYGFGDTYNNFELMVHQHTSIYNAIKFGFTDSAAAAAQKHLETCYSSFLYYYLTKGITS